MEMSKKVSLRALIIGIALIPINCYWIIKTEVVWRSLHATVLSLFFNAVFCLFILKGLSSVIEKFRPRAGLSQSELLTIYIILTNVTALFGFDMMQALIPIIAYSFWHATPENEWANLFNAHIPKWLVVHDKSVLAGYYEGNSTLYTMQNIKAWMVPMLAWSGLVFALVFTMFCINSIVRKQWIENEKLTYPVTWLPVDMADATTGLFRKNLLWIGFAVSGGLGLMHGINFLYPAFPDIRVRYDLLSFFTEKPWNAIGGTPLCFYPFVVGLGYFMPLDLSFSTWFFYLFWKVQAILRVVMGLKPHAGPHWTGESVGAWLSLCLLVLWSSRRHLKEVLKSIFTAKAKDPDEPMSYRTAVLGIIIGMTFLVLFCYQAGMYVWVAVVFFTVYFMLSIAVTRVRAELGPPAHELHKGGPDRLMPDIIGTRRLGRGSLTVFSLFFWFTQSTRSHPMPHQLESLKIADRTGISNRGITFIIVLTTVVGSISFFWIYLHISYAHGWENMRAMMHLAWGPFVRLEGWLNNPTQLDRGLVGGIAIGSTFTAFLMVMRVRFFWWPFHPVGYAVTGNWTMGWTWFSIFIGWLAKWIILRYGGLKVYRQALPFFIGLILGQLIVGSLWSILGTVLDMPVYGFFI